MQRLTAVITMHNRPVHLKHAIKSLRLHYPKLPAVVVADGDMTDACVTLIESDPLTDLYWFQGQDKGNSAMRNFGVQCTATEYVAILEEDFVFTEDTRFDRMIEVLDHDRDAALCCGALYYHGKLQWFANRLNLDEVNKCYETIPIRNPEWKETPGGTKYFGVEYAFNFFVMRRNCGLRWDEELKVAIEHIDFFITMKKEGIWRAAFTPESTAIHDCGFPSKKYAKDRNRYQYWQRFHEKHGYRHGINHAEQCVYDLVNRRPMPYPEYVFFLMKHQRRLEAERPRPSRAAAGGQNG